MNTTRIVVTSMFVLMLGACGTMEAKKMEAKTAAGVSATDCFSNAGTIDNSSGKAVCKMKDGSMKPVY